MIRPLDRLVGRARPDRGLSTGERRIGREPLARQPPRVYELTWLSQADDASPGEEAIARVRDLLSE